MPAVGDVAEEDDAAGHSDRYGNGRVDAATAVRLAQGAGDRPVTAPT